MAKFKITLLILFIIGVIGALNSISNESTVEKERGFISSILNLLGLTYKPEPEDAREFDYVPAKTQSELSKIAGESKNSSPAAIQNQEIKQSNEEPIASPKSAATKSQTPSPKPYEFGFSN